MSRFGSDNKLYIILDVIMLEMCCEPVITDVFCLVHIWAKECVSDILLCSQMTDVHDLWCVVVFQMW